MTDALTDAIKDIKKVARELQQGNSKRNAAEVLFAIAETLTAALSAPATTMMPRAGGHADWWAESVKQYRRFRKLRKAAQAVVDEMGKIHDNDPYPLKYRAPFGAIADLANLLATFPDYPLSAPAMGDQPAWDVVPAAERLLASLPDAQREAIARRLASPRPAAMGDQPVERWLMCRYVGTDRMMRRDHSPYWAECDPDDPRQPDYEYRWLSAPAMGDQPVATKPAAYQYRYKYKNVDEESKWSEWGPQDLTYEGHHYWLTERRPLYATPRPAVDAGWRTVPVEPTEKMAQAGFNTFMLSSSDDQDSIVKAWRRMIAAAPEGEQP